MPREVKTVIPTAEEIKILINVSVSTDILVRAKPCDIIVQLYISFNTGLPDKKNINTEVMIDKNSDAPIEIIIDRDIDLVTKVRKTAIDSTTINNKIPSPKVFSIYKTSPKSNSLPYPINKLANRSDDKA